MSLASTSLVQVGEVLAGKYRVERVLGKGAMGMVVAAMHVELHELRAIKFMLPAAFVDGAGVERFKREARACAKLKSKHVATVYDVGHLDNGAPYIVMEYLEGTDLKEVLTRLKALPVPVAVDYMLQALEAIGEAHQAGIIHRDLKPANMFLTTGVNGASCVKILDFGIAKLAPSPSVGVEHQDMTATQMIMGSPLYMSPEQIRSSRNVDSRSDIWSIGVILYRMVTGSLPFQAPTGPEIFALVLTEDPPSPSRWNPHLPKGFEAIILRCLERDPAKRWSSAADLANALRPYLTGNQEKEADATTHMWRPPHLSIPEGWYGAGSGSTPLSDASPSQGRPMGPPSLSHPTSRVTEGGTIQTGPTPSSIPLPVMFPPPSDSNPLSPSAYSGYSHAPSAPPPEALPTAQTNGTWAQTQMGGLRASPKSRAVAAGAIVGGLLFVALIAVIVALRRGDSMDESPAQAALSGTPQGMLAAPEKQGTSPTAPPEPVVAPAMTATLPPAASSAAKPADAPKQTPAAPPATQKAERANTAPVAQPKKTGRPATETNPFD